MDPTVIATVERMLAEATAADGVAPLSEQAAMAVSRPVAGDGVTHLLARDANDDAVVGYANRIAGRDGEPSMVEAVVEVGARRRGHGRALVSAALERGDNVGSPDMSGDEQVRAWAHGDLPAARALAASLGLTPLRELLVLRRPLGRDAPELPELTVPEGIRLVTYADVADPDAAEAEILRVNNAAFDWHPEQGGWTSDEITERIQSEWFDPAGLFLAYDEPESGREPTRLLGFHWTKVHADENPPIGEVYIVGVDPAAQGRGLGRLLTLAGLHHLRDGDLGEVELYVEGDNTAALHTYERLGFTRFSADVAYG
nr:mycothiol synthase [Gordonia jinhuaensis]